MDFSFDAGITFFEPLPKRWKLVQALLTYDAHTQGTFGRTVFSFDNAERFVPKPENLSCVFVKPLACRRKASTAASRTVKKRNANSSFELADTNAHGGLRAEYTFGGAQETMFFGDRDQHFELHEFHIVLAPSSTPINIEAAIRTG
jgi:hypothetical protein